jgi:hypothetical protein
VKIISGGQTGADRGALDAALDCGFEVGGWVPRGRLAEDGRIADRYSGMIETESPDPGERTCRNVRDAAATVIVSHGPLRGGSQLALDEATRLHKTVLHLDLDVLGPDAAVIRLRKWLEIEKPAVLNVAGPRASEDAAIYLAVKTLMCKVLEP